MNRNYLLFLVDISERIEKIERFIDGMSYGEFVEDEKSVSATIREIEVIGEATKKIPNEIREQFNDLPWSLMAKMRDKLIHWYFEVDEEIVWKVATQKLPDIKVQIDLIIEEIKSK
jgi:uncharacterized protein with HEPN domain